jgi:hypothetical protein
MEWKGVGQAVDKKHAASSFYLIEEQYRGVMYLTIIYPQLLKLITNLYSNYGIYM